VRKFYVEQLESRQLMSMSPAITYLGNVAIISGTDRNDHIKVSQDRKSGQLVVDYNRETFLLDQSAQYLYIRGQGGNDHITNNTSLPAIINGGDGKDKFQGDAATNQFFQEVTEPTFGTLGTTMVLMSPATDDTVVVQGTENGIEANNVPVPLGTTGIIVDLGDGDDTAVDTQQTIPLLVFGGNGNDTFFLQPTDTAYQESP
jgi:hypothetical protein